MAVACLVLACPCRANAQSVRQLSEETQFLSYQRIPTWSAVISDWKSDTPATHLYDYNEYDGHAEFVSRGLITGITFAQFAQQVRHPEQRNYIPFFLFDLRAAPVDVDGKTYQWAVRIEDYGYEDSAAEMTATVARVHRTLTQYLSPENPEGVSLLMVLSRAVNAQPNFEIEGPLNSQGIQGVSLPDLVAAVGAPRVEILNPASAVGTLRFVSAQDMATARYSPTDIVIFEQLPNRVPPVSGIITLMPQTPLSHVNLLARNRGTLNLYALSLDDLPGAEDKLGRLVEIAIDQSRLSISLISQADAEAHWARHKPPTVSIPAPNTQIDRIVDLDESGDAVATDVIGAKASNYSLLQKEFPEYVRPGHALPISWYFDATRSSQFQQLLNELLTRAQNMTPAQIEAHLAQMRSTLSTHSIDAARLQSLRNLVREYYPATRIRLRSSTNCEDLAEFNGAGLYESKGFDSDEDDAKLQEQLLEVYASLWTPQAFAEREFYGIDHRLAGMAVLINEAFPDEYANGVVLTIPGENHFSILINSQPGEDAVTNPEPGQVPESLLFESSASAGYQVESESSIGPVFTAPDMQSVLLELRAVSIRIHEVLRGRLPPNDRDQFGVDIEFKLERETDRIALYVKQARLLGLALPD